MSRATGVTEPIGGGGSVFPICVWAFRWFHVTPAGTGLNWKASTPRTMSLA